ncbi:response regulator transcription factor [Paenibacillus agricola]|uniref:Response regulator n=1 Tax=Paenibacillus agricola TaxID=2716264 RepID=A0ABX0J339_9BACL|nr:response regulator [Paenibacillus agricola]NHN30246.1 response regulator [Paenibacillus agricola]
MYKLVLVDDEVEIRNGLSQYFPWNDIGFDVVGSFENGKQALAYIDAHHVDVMLCDIKMPIMTGLEVAKELHSRKSKIKMILLSGHKDFEYAKQALSYDVKGYIVKPTKYNELYEHFTKLKQEMDKVEEEQTGKQSLNEKGTFNEKVIATIRSYVEQNYKQATLEEAAALVRMNSYYVSRYFKENTGQNFSDFVAEVKMNKATELLKDIRYKTYEISEMVGYSHAKNFTRTFKKHFGMSPREFRNTREQSTRLE